MYDVHKFKQINKCFKEIPNNKQKMLAVWNMWGGGGEVYKKIITFYLADFDRALKNIHRIFVHKWKQ